MTTPLLVTDPACKTEQQIDAYLKEVKAMLMLSFQEQPIKTAAPYAVLGKLQLKVLDVGAALAARECSTLKRKLHELAVLSARVNIESVDLQTEDLL